MHFPAWQLCPDWQTVPQAPQFFLSVWTLAQVPPHSNWPEEQVVAVRLGTAGDEQTGAEESDQGQERSNTCKHFSDSLWGIRSDNQR